MTQTTVGSLRELHYNLLLKVLRGLIKLTASAACLILVRIMGVFASHCVNDLYQILLLLLHTLLVFETVCIVPPHIHVTTTIFCLQKPITRFLTELQFVGKDDILLKMIPESVLCQNYVDLRLQLRRCDS